MQIKTNLRAGSGSTVDTSTSTSSSSQNQNQNGKVKATPVYYAPLSRCVGL